MENKQIVVSQADMKKKAEEVFEEFKVAMKKQTGSSFDKGSEPVAKNIFVNGFMAGIDTVVKMGRERAQKESQDHKLS